MTNCPNCGGKADIIDGSYDFIGEAVSAFRAPGVTRNKVKAFEAIAKEVQSGAVLPADAEFRVAELGDGLFRLWKIANQNSGALGLILAIVAIYLSITAGWSADETAAKLQASVEKQTEVAVKQLEVERMILTELHKQNEAAPKPAASYWPKTLTHMPAQQQRPTQAKSNRHERRKAAAKARRQPSV